MESSEWRHAPGEILSFDRPKPYMTVLQNLHKLKGQGHEPHRDQPKIEPRLQKWIQLRWTVNSW